MTYYSKNFIHSKIDQHKYSKALLNLSYENLVFNKTTSRNASLSYIEKPNKAEIFNPKEISSRIIKEAKSLTSIEEALKLYKKHFLKGQELANRLAALIDLHDEEDASISLDSLKAMLIFLGAIAVDFKTPSITLNENGTFQANWRKNNSSLITLRFKEENFIDYVIFKPSQHTKKPIILNGSMNLFDLIEYIKDLGLMRLIKG